MARPEVHRGRALQQAPRAVTPSREWRRPVPLVGDPSSAAERAAQPDAWAFPAEARDSLHQIIAARRDVRRYRPDPVDGQLLERVLRAAHGAPSVGHSQPWRFIVVTEPATRERAAWMADCARLAQAAKLDPAAARQLLDLQLEGIREAPVGVVVCCDRRAPAAGILGRATFRDADIWSCMCAIQNLWLAARAEGLGVGWVTLFPPAELAALVGLPPDVVPLGWLCVGWPDERPPGPGLERAGWSSRLPLADVVLRERWPAADDEPVPPVSRLRAPAPHAVVSARDDGDELLTPAGSLGLLDRAVDRLLALGKGDITGGTLVIAAGRHPVAELGVTTFEPSLTDDLLAAARCGEALGAVAAREAGLDVVVVDAGTSAGNLRDAVAMPVEQVLALIDAGKDLGRDVGSQGLCALGEIGIGNTTVASLLASLVLELPPGEVVGLGAGGDTATIRRKRQVVTDALVRCRSEHGLGAVEPVHALACGGGPEIALLTGVTIGAAEAGSAVVTDGLATSLAALLAARLEPGVSGYLIAGHRSREAAHPAVLRALGLEPLLDLRVRAGEGAGAAFACGVLLHALRTRAATARTAPGGAERRG